MGLESATYISELNEAWPLGSDGKNTLDNHARLTKAVLKNTFPNVSAAVTGTAAQINAAVASGGLSTVSSSATSLSISVASKSLTVEASKGFAAGQAIQLTYDLTNYMTGNVTSYNTLTGALVVSVTAVVGAGTYAAWAVFVTTPGAPFSDATALVMDSADSTKLAKFDAGSITTATTRTYILPDASGTMALTVGDHCVSLHTGNGHGSTNNKIRRYTTAMTNVGTAMTYADSAANGASITINEAGIYAISSTDINANTGLYTAGASVNSAQLTTSIQSISVANRLMWGTSGGTPFQGAASVVVKLAASDVVRPHGDGNPSDTTDKVTFTIRKVGT